MSPIFRFFDHRYPVTPRPITMWIHASLESARNTRNRVKTREREDDRCSWQLSSGPCFSRALPVSASPEMHRENDRYRDPSTLCLRTEAVNRIDLHERVEICVANDKYFSICARSIKRNDFSARPVKVDSRDGAKAHSNRRSYVRCLIIRISNFPCLQNPWSDLESDRNLSIETVEVDLSWDKCLPLRGKKGSEEAEIAFPFRRKRRWTKINLSCNPRMQNNESKKGSVFYSNEWTDARFCVVVHFR